MKAVLKFDGGSRGNPGPSACAYLIECDGKILIDGDSLGNATNNYAEWMGLVNGLKTLMRRVDPDKTDLEIFADSELVVKQITGEYKTKNANLAPLRMMAMRILSDFKSYKISHVKREFNKECDTKVNEILNHLKQ
ncbi:MAG: ribonuclease HI family protein [bacterium]